VTEGHPDKVCDFISDSVLDAYLAAIDPAVACEILCKGGDVVLAVKSLAAVVDHESIVRQAIREIGYTDDSEPFSADSIKLT
jgi:S-adenosylmethionine synthetase